ncbi:ParB/RepB/Spo0J family partition protein [Vampirovibrio sp.]|uniref:ParB/RepB/Spo0J family partition protein n=1 Tax=Vampirovibrio sp. TaxID=2717857 RepID=UPI00359396CB
MTQIALQLLDNDPRNSNVCSNDMLEKLQRNIERTGFYPSLIVRPHDNDPERFIIIDGHHRKLVLEKLGKTKADCVIWSITDQEAQIALATLNTLRGTENLKKRAELVQSLSQILPINELAKLLPEAEADIQDLLALLDHDVAALEQSMQAQLAEEKVSLPVPFTFLVAASDVSDVERALKQFQPEKADRGLSLVALCHFALKQLEAHHVESKAQ